MDSETMIPTDKEVSKWYDENIDKDCSASSAIYKFRQWLEEYKLLNNKPTDEEYEDKILGEMLELAKSIPLHAKLRIAFTMDDYGNWDNGEYKGDKKLIEKYVNSAIRIFEEQLLNNNSDGWISTEDKPLVSYCSGQDYDGKEHKMWQVNEGVPDEFLAALEVCDKIGNITHWWIRHCVIEDETGLCVVGDDENVPAGWQITDVEFYRPLPPSPPIQQPKYERDKI